jgi:hypothetical protein
VAFLALSACGATPAEQPTPQPAATAVAEQPTAQAEPTAQPEPPTAVAEQPSATPEPAAPTPAPPTEPPPAPPTEAPPAPPTPTLEPLVSNTIPEDGDFSEEIPYNTVANDPGVGPNDGDGIADVTFRFIGPDGQEVFRNVEQNPRYCAFGGGDDGGDCDRWIFFDHSNEWPNGKPAQNGPHKLIVTVRGERGGTAQNQRNITLNLNQESTILVNTFLTRDRVGDQNSFRVAARDSNVGEQDGAGIVGVTFQFFDSQGQAVYEHTENTARYCAFAGGENGQDCNLWRFSEHDNQWPSGIPVEDGGFYSLQVTVEASSGEQATRELDFTIQL